MGSIIPCITQPGRWSLLTCFFGGIQIIYQTSWDPDWMFLGPIETPHLKYILRFLFILEVTSGKRSHSDRWNIPIFNTNYIFNPGPPFSSNRYVFLDPGLYFGYFGGGKFFISYLTSVSVWLDVQERPSQKSYNSPKSLHPLKSWRWMVPRKGDL